MYLEKYLVEVGSSFDPNSNPVVYFDDNPYEGLQYTLSDVTPGEYVTLYNNLYTLVVPSDASKFLVYTEENMELGTFLDKDNKPVSRGYLIYKPDNFISLKVSESESESER